MKFNSQPTQYLMLKLEKFKLKNTQKMTQVN